MLTEIYHVASRCGAGKSRETINELIRHLLDEGDGDRAYLLASKTNELTGENFEYAKQLIQSHAGGNSLAIERVDSTNNKGTVVRDLESLLESEFKGIIFVSHRALASINAAKLSNTRVVTDEAPQDLAGTLMVRYEARDTGYPWEKYLIEVPSAHTNYTRVEIAPGADREDMRRYIRGIQQNRDTATTQDVADLLEFLLEGYEAAYTTTTRSDGSIYRVYQAVHYHRLQALATHVDFLAILAAQLDQTLFGFISQHLLGLPIVERDITDQITLVRKHRNQVRIVPLLDSGRWSTTLREKPAYESLTRGGHPISSKESVGQFAQTFAAQLLKQEPAVITLNDDEPLAPSLSHLKDSLTSTHVHGMNHFRHLDHAVYLASTNPTPFENKILSMFAKNHELEKHKLTRAIMVERCYEVAYQCVARTSIRNTLVDPDKEHLIIVPDMHYAKYIESWFEPGCVTIDTQYSYQVERNRKKKDLKITKQFNLVVHIITQHKQKKGKLPQLVAQAGISMSTFKRYREEFRPELEVVGLIKPKRQQAIKQTA
ncbi:hypothetical protein [Halovibrio salipaludis]|nr:hypothetical protein [Halovibrio salipaludis]